MSVCYTLVTGAASDIGRSICSKLEEQGHCLLLTDLLEESLVELRKELVTPEKHLILPMDLSDVEGSKTILGDFLVRHQVCVSHVVFAAGIFSVKPLRVLQYEYLKKSFDISVFSVCLLTQVLVSKKINGDCLKSVVIVSSISALRGTRGYCVYGAVKSSLLGMMKSLAAELAPKTRVNAILPGGIRTRATAFIYDNQAEPDPRYLLGEGSPSNISDVVSFLISEDAKWITGQGIIVDGGYMIS